MMINKKEYLFNSILFSLILVSVLFANCSKGFVRNKEARDDEKEMQRALKANEKIKNVVQAKVETESVFANNIDDDTADDPAIWYNIGHPENSVIYGSNKLHGVHSYNLKGKELQYIPCGTVNNIDIRQDLNFTIGKRDVLAGSHRIRNSVVLFIINKDGALNETFDHEINLGEFEPYGFCLYKNKSGVLNAFVNSKSGLIYQISIDINLKGELESTIINQFKLETQVEGMVVDDVAGMLYVGEEQRGIFVFDLSRQQSKGKLLNGSTDTNGNVRYDIEGLALINSEYLLASSQGNFSYAVFDLKDEKYVDSFKIGEGNCDRVEETDGIEIITKTLGPNFPKGALIVQDGFNYDGDEKKSQNFKIIDLRDVIDICDINQL